jgi:hypothetical protein
MIYEAYGYYVDNGEPARQGIYKELALVPLSGLAYGTIERAFRWHQNNSKWKAGKEI